MDREERRRALRDLSATLTRIDVAVYRDHGRDPAEPIFGEGELGARLCLFGRDPGREEVRHGLPFVGAGGQKVRRELALRAWGRPPADLADSIEVGRLVYWANTVPYKPVGNKAWGRRDVRRFRPLVADLLLTGWGGRHVLTLGRVAFDWFGLDDRGVRDRLRDHWARDDAFTTSVDVPLAADGVERTLTVHPLPHPSPLNATWASRFPGLLAARLAALGWGADTWRDPAAPG